MSRDLVFIIEQLSNKVDNLTLEVQRLNKRVDSLESDSYHYKPIGPGINRREFPNRKVTCETENKIKDFIIERLKKEMDTVFGYNSEDRESGR